MEARRVAGRAAGQVEVRPEAVPVVLLVDRLGLAGLRLRRRRDRHKRDHAIRTRAAGPSTKSKIRLTEAR